MRCTKLCVYTAELDDGICTAWEHLESFLHGNDLNHYATLVYFFSITGA